MSTKILKWIKEWYPLFLILIFATLLRAKLLFTKGDFWFDEVYSAHYAMLPWSEFIKYAIIETNPPLYTLFLRGWISIVGQNDILIRLPSLIFSLGLITTTYITAKQIFNKTSALTSSLIITLSSLSVYLSVENRVYSLLALLCSLSFFIYYKINWQGINTKTIWIAYFIVQLLLFYSHLTASLFIIIQIAFSYYLNNEYKKNILKTNILASLPMILWLIPSVISKLNSSFSNSWYVNNIAGTNSLADAITGIFINSDPLSVLKYDSQFIFTLAIVGLVIVLFFSLNKLKIEKTETKNLLAFIICWILIPPILGSLLGNPIPKFFYYTLSGWSLLIGYIINKVKNQNLIIFVIFSLLFPSALNITNFKIADWNKIYNRINENSNGKIIVAPFHEALILKRYYGGTTPYTGAYVYKDNLKFEERVGRYNWQNLICDQSCLNNWMTEETKNFDKIYIIQQSGKFSILTKWLEDNGWVYTEQKKSAVQHGFNIYEFSSSSEKIYRKNI